MKFVVDRIIDNIVILEEVYTKDKKEININLLPINIKDGSVLIYEDNQYILNLNDEEIRRKILRDKLDRLKNVK